MKLFKGILLTSALMLLVSCGQGSKSADADRSEEQPTTSQTSEEAVSSEETTTSEKATSSEETTTSEQQETIEIKKVEADISSFEKVDNANVVYVGKEYVVKVYAYGDDLTTPLESEQIEYNVQCMDGTTVITSGVRAEAGEKANEFVIKVFSTKYTDFDLGASARVKDGTWLSADIDGRITVINPNEEW